MVDTWRTALVTGTLAALVPLLLAACGTTAAPTATPAPETPVAIVPAIATPDPNYVPPQTPWRPVPLPTVSPADPVTPWPPADLREEIIQFVLNDPETLRLLGDHRYRVFGVIGSYHVKNGTCSIRPVSCVTVSLYDYTVPTGLKVVVNFVTREVVHRWIIAEHQSAPSQDELVEIANTQGLGTDAKLSHGVAGVYLISDTKFGGQCGSSSPLHRCLMVYVTKPNGDSLEVVVDMVERKVVRVSPWDS